MNHDSYDNAYISGILKSVKTIAVVGASANDVRPSFFVMKYMLDKGYRVVPVNPGQAGKLILGQMTYARLSDIPVPIDMVDVFRASDAVPGHCG
jgi:predicted CoA-binding protein